MSKLTVERVINAPIEDVFDAWTIPQIMQEWLSPEGMTTPTVESSFNQGGNYMIVMEGKNGERHIAYGTYTKINKPHEVEMTWSWDKDDDDSKRSKLNLKFEKVEDNKTKVILHHYNLPSEEECQNHEKGWISSFNKLEKKLHE
ncbi:MAG: hypothetical protein COU27_02115 [Candidatus Levybacteria bacterium CG10_big_fil_rev_8_21_14_0_10_36_7]|nr:MAG: hypothetical protein COU27_02115 [Candidatus Levybacteria bacterium CG10_big_fil_rev_8_21_14_0_10_36_7]